MSLRSGFTGGLVVDHPNSRNKKIYLCLKTQEFSDKNGMSASLPKAVEIGDKSKFKMLFSDKIRKIKNNTSNLNNRSRLIKKKAKLRAKGVDNLSKDSKYSGRKRNKFY